MSFHLTADKHAACNIRSVESVLSFRVVFDADRVSIKSSQDVLITAACEGIVNAARVGAQAQYGYFIAEK